MDEEKRVINLTVVLFKENVTDYSETCENYNALNKVDIKEKFGFEGKIIYSDSKDTIPKWKAMVDELSETRIELSANTSNKAVIIVKVEERFMGVIFGYGRSLLREDKLERNFGLKAALNMISAKQMRSVQSAAIEDMIVSTHKQASRRTSQDEFDLNVFNDILRSVSGKTYDEDLGNTVSGKDTLSVSVAMDIDELGEKLKSYLKAYQDTRYKDIGFNWIDNINEVRDTEMKNRLNNFLVVTLLKKDFHNLYITPSEIIDHETTAGFCFSGIRKNLNDSENYSYDPDIEEYVKYIDEKDTKKVLDKLRRHKLYSIDFNGNNNSVCSIYNAIVWQCTYNQKTYILWNGAWYYVENNFLNEVNSFVDNIPMSNIVLPKCRNGEKEGDYNIRAANSSKEYYHMDRKLIRVKGGSKEIESCDLFSKDKQMIHVKKRDSSSTLSHLFSQGRVASECFLSDEYFRKQVYDLMKGKLGYSIFDYKKKPESNEFEVIYAIIAKKSYCSRDKLFFFSKVNLMLTCQALERTRFKYSICFVEME